MKNIILLSVIGIFLTNCSSQDTAVEDNTPSSIGSFLSIRIATDNMGTRAAGDEYHQGDGDYKDGEAYENYVSSVLFFFFDDNGNAAVAAKTVNGEYKTYQKWDCTNRDNSFGGEDHSQTVEKTLVTTLPIVVPYNQSLPTQILAVLNPTPEIEEWAEQKLSIKQWAEKYENYKYNERNKETLEVMGKFVMSNSVYVDNSNIVNTTRVSRENYGHTQEEADAHPVIVYVERVLARLDFVIGIEDCLQLPDGTVIYKASSEPIEIDDKTKKDIYVKFLGWNIISTPNKSRLIKSVNPNWNSSTLFKNILIWNSTDYHRSFWAINLDKNLFQYEYGPLLRSELGSDKSGSIGRDGMAANQFAIPSKGEYKTIYLQENAAPYENNNLGTENPTKFIIAAQLVDKEGNPIEYMAQWAGKKYTLRGLLTAIAGQKDANSPEGLRYLYQKEVDALTGNTKYTRISPDDLELEYITGSGNKFNIKLTSGARQYTWVLYDSSTHTVTREFANADDVDAYISSETVGKVMVWENGYAYFHNNIRHLGDEGSPGEFGIVRNHIYEVKVTKINGFGTPVYDPDEDVIPSDDPEDSEFSLSATVRILSWRVVHQDYDLNW